MHADEPDREDAAAEEGPQPAADPAEVARLADRMLQGLGLDVRAEARDAGATIEVDIAGGDRDVLLARKGEGLNATQYLLNRILYRGRRGKKIHVDSGGFRRLREEEIVEIARRAAEKARASGEEIPLSPLNPYERRLVHLALAEMDGVETRSIGDGFLKKVVIVPTHGPGAGPARPPRRD
jgi:spoIIIJ-associated protein